MAAIRFAAASDRVTVVSVMLPPAGVKIRRELIEADDLSNG
jgi:hypothetical protein